MRVVLAAAIVASLAVPALAPVPRAAIWRDGKERTAPEGRRPTRLRRGLQASLGAIPDKGPTDPWGTVRSTEAPKPRRRPRPRNPRPRQPTGRPQPSRSERSARAPLTRCD